MGGLHDHPSPINAIHRLKLILLGRNPGIVQRNANIQGTQDTEEQYLTAEVFAKGGIDISVPPLTEKAIVSSPSSSSSTSSSPGSPSTSTIQGQSSYIPYGHPLILTVMMKEIL